MALAMETGIVTQPTVVPSKWDIIPVHASDVSAYKRCRRYWHWSSPTRTNLRRRVEIHGVKMELWFGTGIHYALEVMYDPILQRDPVEAFQTWWEYQWNGGIVTEDWLDRTYDIHPQQVTWDDLDADPVQDIKDFVESDGEYVPVYKIKGLKTLLPNVEVVQDDFMAHRELGIGMLNFYKDWAKVNDDFVSVAAESVFSIPLGFHAVDRREDSPNYGKKLEVHARGKRDNVIYYPEWDRYGINDYKTAVRIDDNYFLKLEKDEQVTQYLWATMEEAKLDSSLPWSGEMVDRCEYTALRKAFPVPPVPTYKDTRLSLAKDAPTNATLFEEALRSNEVWHAWFKESEDAQKYFQFLREQGDEKFVIRKPVYRNKYEIKAFDRHLKMIAKEMLNPKTNIYPAPSGSWMCTGCQFRAPCIAADDGSDWQGMLADAYEVNRDR
jgi:dTDP-4-dehydrorhamnose 3,5-epimerase-like enzyme